MLSWHNKEQSECQSRTPWENRSMVFQEQDSQDGKPQSTSFVAYMLGVTQSKSKTQ